MAVWFVIRMPNIINLLSIINYTDS